MSYAHLALGFAFVAIAAVNFARAAKATDGKTERNARAAGALFTVAGIAFFVAAGLSFATGR